LSASTERFVIFPLAIARSNNHSAITLPATGGKGKKEQEWNVG
jgi:hypothetical protein